MLISFFENLIKYSFARNAIKTEILIDGDINGTDVSMYPTGSIHQGDRVERSFRRMLCFGR